MLFASDCVMIVERSLIVDSWVFCAGPLFSSSELWYNRFFFFWTGRRMFSVQTCTFWQRGNEHKSPEHFLPRSKERSARRVAYFFFVTYWHGCHVTKPACKSARAALPLSFIFLSTLDFTVMHIRLVSLQMELRPHGRFLLHPCFWPGDPSRNRCSHVEWKHKNMESITRAVAANAEPRRRGYQLAWT